jgi:O-antigen/teichoic acid export membrane protein
MRTTFPPALYAVALRGLGSVLQLVLAIVVGRLFGAEGLGDLYLLISWTAFAAVAIAFGFPTLVLRRAADHAQQRDFAAALAFGRQAASVVLVIGLIVSLAMWAVLSLSGFLDDAVGGVHRYFAYILAGSIAVALTRLISDLLKGLGKPLAALSLEFVITPGLAAILIAVMVMGSEHDDNAVLMGYTAAALITLIAAAAASRSLAHWRASGKTNGLRLVEGAQSKDLFHFWGIQMLNQMYPLAPYLIMPFYVDQSAIGEFGLAHRLVSVGATINLALGSVYAAKLRHAFNLRDEFAMKEAYRKSQLLSVALYLPLLFVFVVAGYPLISLFGIESHTAVTMLLLMGVIRLLTSAGGVADIAVLMTGMQRSDLKAAFAIICVFFLLTPLALEMWGVVGVAVAFSLAFFARICAAHVIFTQGMRRILSHVD